MGHGLSPPGLPLSGLPADHRRAVGRASRGHETEDHLWQRRQVLPPELTGPSAVVQRFRISRKRPSSSSPRHCLLRQVPALGGPPRGGCPGEAPHVQRLGVLGPAGARLRRPQRSVVAFGSRSCRPRGKPNGPDVHRGPKRRLGLRHAPQVSASPSRPTPKAGMTAKFLKTCTSPPPSAAPHRVTSRSLKKETTAFPFWSASLNYSRRSRWSWFSVNSLSTCTWASAPREARALPSPRPKFRHAAVYRLAGGITLAASYHPSQHNTLTGRLTREMFEGVFDMAKQLLA